MIPAGRGVATVSIGKLVLKRRSAPLRCAYCHSAFLEESRVRSCEGCGLTLHEECRGGLRQCPALGCNTDYSTGLKNLPTSLPLSELLALDTMTRLEARLSAQTWFTLWSRAWSRASVLFEEPRHRRTRLAVFSSWLWIAWPLLSPKLPTIVFVNGPAEPSLSGDFSSMAIFFSGLAAALLILRELRPFAATHSRSESEDPLNADRFFKNPILPSLRELPLAAVILFISAWASVLHWAIISSSLAFYAPFLYLSSLAHFLIQIPFGAALWAAFARNQRKSDDESLEAETFEAEALYNQILKLPNLHLFAAENSRQKHQKLSMNIQFLRLSLFFLTSFFALLGPIAFACFLPLAAAWGAEFCLQFDPLIEDPEP